jgi:RNA polymerase sigma-70 factor (ECF subfamily)
MDDFLQQVERYKDEFYRYVLRVAWDSGAADDIFSSAVLAAWENRHKFTPGTNFRAWMYRILTNKCFVANRETRRTPRPLEDVPELALLDMSADRGYQDVLEHPEGFLDQCGDEVYQAMHQLSTAQRACILLRSVEKFSYKEIAEILDIPVGTVMTHLSRGRAKLRAALMDYAREQGILRTRPRLLRKPRGSKAANETREAEGIS